MTGSIIRRVRRVLRRTPRLEAAVQSQRMRWSALRHAAAARFPGLIRPLHENLTIAITARCNLACHGCRYGRDFMPGAELSLPMMRDLLDDASAAGYRTVRLYGGEPLLHHDLPAMVEHAIARGIEPYVTTNGALLGRRIEELYTAGLRSITFGYYGTGPAYDQYVQRERSHERLEASIRSVRERYGNKVYLRLNWLLMRPTCNLGALASMWEFCKRYETPVQVDLLHYSLPYFTEGPEGKLKFRPEDRPAIEKIVAKLLEYRRERPGLLMHSEIGLRAIPEWLLRGSAMRVPCDKYRMLWVGADGTVQLCYVTFRLGNLHEQRLRDMIDSAAHKRAALGAFQLRCPNCHCGYDERTQKDFASRRAFG